MRIEKARMRVIPRGLKIFVESRHRGGGPWPGARLRSGGAVVKVVINHGGRPIFVDLRFDYREKAAGPCIDDVVRKNIVRHVPLHLELAGASSRGIVFVERIVDHRGVIDETALRRIASDGNTRGMAVINKVISCGDVAGGAVLVLTG